MAHLLSALEGLLLAALASDSGTRSPRSQRVSASVRFGDA
jgi:hypothetical protein